MTLALLQELLMALRANDVDGYKSWLALVIEELGRDVAVEVESEWMVRSFIGGRGERQADGLAAGSEALTLVQGAQQMQAKIQAVQLMTYTTFDADPEFLSAEGLKSYAAQCIWLHKANA